MGHMAIARQRSVGPGRQANHATHAPYNTSQRGVVRSILGNANRVQRQPAAPAQQPAVPLRTGTGCSATQNRAITDALSESGTWASSVRGWFDQLKTDMRGCAGRAAGPSGSGLGSSLFTRYQLLKRHFRIDRDPQVRSFFPRSAAERLSVQQISQLVHVTSPIQRQFRNYSHSNITFECDPPCPTGRSGADVLGDAVAGSGHFRIHTDCFDPQHSTTKTGVVMHEVFHARSTSFNHDSYGFESDYPGTSPLTNADSYATFASYVATGSNYRIIQLPAMRVQGRVTP
jgi:hypothetical protein